MSPSVTDRLLAERASEPEADRDVCNAVKPGSELVLREATNVLIEEQSDDWSKIVSCFFRMVGVGKSISRNVEGGDDTRYVIVDGTEILGLEVELINDRCDPVSDQCVFIGRSIGRSR